MPKLRSILALVLGVAVMSPGGLRAQSTDPVTELGDVTVEGRRLQDEARAFVDAVAATPSGARLARWSDPICVGVAGVRAPYGQAMADRISAVAADIGLAVASPGCAPNVLIVATDDGPGTARELVRRLFLRFDAGYDHANLGREALERFRTSPAPVRWWHMAVPVNVDSGEVAARRAGGPAPIMGVRSPGLGRSTVRYDLTKVTVVIGADRVGSGLSDRALPL